jgi:hypothetical protein
MTDLAHHPSIASPLRRRAPRLALGAVAGPVLLTLSWLVLGAISPGYTVLGTRIAPYSPITQPISGLGLGVTGPYMNLLLIISGRLLLAGIVGIIGSLPPKAVPRRGPPAPCCWRWPRSV